LLSGRYANDLAVRFGFTGIPQEKLTVIESIPEAAAALEREGGEDLYVVTCFSDRDKLLDLPAVKKEAL
ncbi:MAG: MurT ligase domain-containing protein, partial [Oscillospiraceae bacterium]|nr:MurT ligase domain-containing protein [Oscillospiraceae bacterium]